MSEGTIVRIVGPVVDVDFSEAEKVPKIYDALEITSEVGNENHRLVLEVHLIGKSGAAPAYHSQAQAQGLRLLLSHDLLHLDHRRRR